MATKEKQPDSGIVLMIDNETLDLTPTAHITQVGFIIGNVYTGDIYVPRTTVWMSDDQPKATVDLDTVRWWTQQDPKVSKSVFYPPDGQQRVTVKELFDVFKDYAEQYPTMTVYASPAMFDLPQLTHLFGGRKPWRYNNERDLMTLYKLVDPHGLLQPPANNMHHDAGYDAEWQFNYLSNVMQRLTRMQALWDSSTVPKTSTFPGPFDEFLKNPGT